MVSLFLKLLTIAELTGQDAGFVLLDEYGKKKKEFLMPQAIIVRQKVKERVRKNI